MKRKSVLLVYDKQCPVCENYCQMVQIRQDIGELVLVDAREKNEIMQEITHAGLDIDRGMVLKMDDVLYYGADAIHVLSLISSRSSTLNQLNYWLFRSRKLSKISYPILRFIRHCLLKVLGKSKVNNLQIKNNYRF